MGQICCCYCCGLYNMYLLNKEYCLLAQQNNPVSIIQVAEKKKNVTLDLTYEIKKAGIVPWNTLNLEQGWVHGGTEFNGDLCFPRPRVMIFTQYWYWCGNNNNPDVALERAEEVL